MITFFLFGGVVADSSMGEVESSCLTNADHPPGLHWGWRYFGTDFRSLAYVATAALLGTTTEWTSLSIRRTINFVSSCPRYCVFCVKKFH